MQRRLRAVPAAITTAAATAIAAAVAAAAVATAAVAATAITSTAVAAAAIAAAAIAATAVAAAAVATAAIAATAIATAAITSTAVAAAAESAAQPAVTGSAEPPAGFERRRERDSCNRFLCVAAAATPPRTIAGCRARADANHCAAAAHSRSHRGDRESGHCQNDGRLPRASRVPHPRRE